MSDRALRDVRPLESGEVKLYIGHEAAPVAMTDLSQPAAISVLESLARQYFVGRPRVRGTITRQNKGVGTASSDPERLVQHHDRRLAMVSDARTQ